MAILMEESIRTNVYTSYTPNILVATPIITISWNKNRENIHIIRCTSSRSFTIPSKPGLKTSPDMCSPDLCSHQPKAGSNNSRSRLFYLWLAKISSQESVELSWCWEGYKYVILCTIGNSAIMGL